MTTSNMEMNLADDLATVLEQEPEVAMLVCEPPISFHRIFGQITGSATASLLLSCYMDCGDKSLDPQRWFVCTASECQQKTALSRREQATARKILKSLELIEERRSHFPATLEVRINDRRLSELVVQLGRERGARQRALRAQYDATQAIEMLPMATNTRFTH